MVLGHEGSGVVEEVGGAVTAVKPGDRVVLSYDACGQCRFCLSGRYTYCEHAMAINFGGPRLDERTRCIARAQKSSDIFRAVVLRHLCAGQRAQRGESFR